MTRLVDLTAIEDALDRVAIRAAVDLQSHDLTQERSRRVLDLAALVAEVKGTTEAAELRRLLNVAAAITTERPTQGVVDLTDNEVGNPA